MSHVADSRKKVSRYQSVTPLPRAADTGQAPPPPPPPPYDAQQPVQPQQRTDAKTCLIVGIILGALAIFMILVLYILAAVLLTALLRPSDAARRASCQGNLKQLARVCGRYAEDEPEGRWPPLSRQDGMLMFEPDSVYPEYFTHLPILVCPSGKNTDAPTEIDDHSYYYFGYVLTTEDEFLAFLESYPDFIAAGADFSQDLPAPPGRGSFGGDTFLRLREGVFQEMGREQSLVPVMFDAASISGAATKFNHVPSGCNVLYMDGHVAFMRYPGQFPITPKILEALGRLDR